MIPKNTLNTTIAVLLLTFIAVAQNKINRSRGEPMYECENANTIGAGNVWVSFQALGFIWDADSVRGQNSQKPEPYAFPKIEAEVGLFDIASLQVKLRPVSYGWKFGWLSCGTKFTFLKNKDLRFQYVGLKIDYHHSFLDQISSSIAGYRNTEGTGFSPEGFITAGGNLKVLALYDLDFLAKFSWLPIKVSTNIGVRVPFEKGFLDYSQYIVTLGVAFVGLGADIFIEYNLEGFTNSSGDPKQFKFDWPSWQSGSYLPREYKVWEVAFPENPMYLTIGGRIRYPRGTVLYGALPLLISQNVGSTTRHSGVGAVGENTIAGNFPDEYARGVTDGFDPWFAKWKVILQVSFPLRYRLTSSEMRRNFLLLKNKKERKRINIDNRINLKKERSKKRDENQKNLDEQDKKKRLEKIKKRRENIKNAE